ncbi:hypothetical protein KSU1_D0089 [Candidatus Jettenia caeni]|uniref:Uncharacterized protein n=1 Tax=Candidatus Jettenia caeni TaxID=247490 RepID=I3INV3_9BACT|nr:hypothetical protein KSU1_D0089 [Candidatus Jettenia caeni]
MYDICTEDTNTHTKGNEQNKLSAFIIMKYVSNSYIVSLSKAPTERNSWQVHCY